MTRPLAIATAIAGIVGLGVGCGDAAPSAPVPLTGAVAVSVGSAHACAVLQDGKVVCWGDDAFGELGTSDLRALSTPVVVPGLDGIKAVAAGEGHSCALDSVGSVWCWGDNIWGELGNGTGVGALAGAEAGKVYDATPIAVKGLSSAADALEAGGKAFGQAGAYTCARVAGGTVECWGQNSFGLGPMPNDTGVAPVALPSLSNVREISFGDLFGCAVLDTGVSCWGVGALGQPGQNDVAEAPSPLPVPGLERAVGVALGRDRACALLGDGHIECWGSSVGPPAPDSPTPVPVALPKPVAAIAAGGFQICAMFSDGTVSCWGLTNARVPVAVVGVRNATAISVGESSACALIADGTVRCWGSNGSGQLGDGGVLTTSETIDPSTKSVLVVAPDLPGAS